MVITQDIIEIALRERMLSEQMLKSGPGLGSMEPERQSRMVKIVWRSPSRWFVRRWVKKKAAGIVLR